MKQNNKDPRHRPAH